MKDAILQGGSSEDAVLNWLIDITKTAIREKVPLFPDVLRRPTFYEKFFKRWVYEGMEDERAVNEARESLVASTSYGGE